MSESADPKAATRAKLLAFIARCDDPKDLREMLRKAREQGEAELEAAAFARLIGLVPGEAPGTLEHDFWRMVHAFEHMRSEENGRRTLLSRTRQKVKRVGVRQTLTDWALDGKSTQGFSMLMERDLPELTGEAIVLRHAQHFPDEVSEAARRRLERAGVEDPTILRP
jgi:hypothetical protein